MVVLRPLLGDDRLGGLSDPPLVALDAGLDERDQQIGSCHVDVPLFRSLGIRFARSNHVGPRFGGPQGAHPTQCSRLTAARGVSFLPEEPFGGASPRQVAMLRDGRRPGVANAP